MTSTLKSIFRHLTAACLVMASGARGQYYEWTVFAGNDAGPGVTDGPVAGALCHAPAGACVDGGGDLILADTENHAIRRITPGGTVSTVAGFPGVSGSSNGTGSAARFNAPSAVAADTNGNLYVADRLNHTIRKINAAGEVTTLAGEPGSPGSTNGTGSSARFNRPDSLVADSGGNVFVTDWNNHTIRKVTPAGAVTSFAGSAGMAGSSNGTGAAARFNFPTGIALDAGGNLYVADSGNYVIRRVTPAAAVTVFAGVVGQNGHVDGSGSVVRFGSVAGLTRDGGNNLHVAQSNSSTIRRVTAAGVVSTLAGTAGSNGFVNGTGNAARFNLPRGVAADAAGNVYVADTGNHAVRKVAPGGVTTTLFGGPLKIGSTNGQGTAARFNRPGAICLDAGGNLYVTDNNTLRKITPGGLVSTLAGSPGMAAPTDGTGSAARFVDPTAVAAAPNGNLYVTDGPGLIRRATPAGTVITVAGSAAVTGSTDGTGPAARFNNPFGLAVDGSGTVFIADASNHTIRRMTPAFAVSTIAGSAGMAGTTDGTGSAARFRNPFGLALKSGGELIIADYRNHSLRSMSPANAVTTLAGTPGTPGTADGAANGAGFDMPYAVAVDSGGQVFVADESNATIRLITPGGNVSTIGGSAGHPHQGTGPGGSARFNFPRGIAVTPQGVVYVSDHLNHRIVKGVFVVPDSTTLPPVLSAPADGAVNGDAVPVVFTLPEAALPGSVRLTFTGAAVRVLMLSLTTAATHGLNIDAANPAASPGVSSVSGGADIPYGTYAVSLTYQDAAGNAAASDTAATVTVSPLAVWKLTHLGDAAAADDDDADFDGLTNLEEYALLQPPHLAGASPVVASGFSYPDGRRLRAVVPRDPARREATIVAEGSSHPGGPWTVLASSVHGAPFAGPGYVGGDSAAAGIKSVELRDVVSFDTALRRFLRVRVER